MPLQCREDAIHLYPVLKADDWVSPLHYKQSSDWSDANYWYDFHDCFWAFPILQISKADPFNITKAINPRAAGGGALQPQHGMGCHVYNGCFYGVCVLGAFPGNYTAVLVIDITTWAMVAEKRLASGMMNWLESAVGIGNKLYGSQDEAASPTILSLNLDTWAWGNQARLLADGADTEGWNRTLQVIDHGAHGEALYAKIMTVGNTHVFLCRLNKDTLGLEAYLVLPYADGGADGYRIGSFDGDEDYIYADGMVRTGGVSNEILYKLNRADLSIVKVIKCPAVTFQYIKVGNNKIIVVGGYPETGIFTFNKDLELLTVSGYSQAIECSPQTAHVPTPLTFLGVAEEEVILVNKHSLQPYFHQLKITERPWCTCNINVPPHQYSTCDGVAKTIEEITVTPGGPVLTCTTSAFVLGISDTTLITHVDTEDPTVKKDDCCRFWPPVVVAPTVTTNPATGVI